MSLYKVFLALHVVCGFTALFTGLVPMFVKKGGRTHNTWGNVYYWAMFGVFVTTLAMFGLRPTELRLQFFLMIAIFSFYNTFSGVRALRTKTNTQRPALLDWAAAGLTLACGLTMLAYGAWQYAAGARGLAILFVVFGSACTAFGIQDLKLFAGKTSHEKMHWFFRHLGRMMGSYAATATAFLVNMSRYLPDWAQLITWIAPGLLVNVVIILMIRKYRKQFASPKAPLRSTPVAKLA